MSKIAGYARRKDPQWFNAIIVIVFFLLLCLLIYGYAFISSRPENIDEKKEEIKKTVVAKEAQVTSVSPEAVISPAIVKGLTIEKVTFTAKPKKGSDEAEGIEKVSLKEVRSVYCYTRVSSATVPFSLKHVWVSPDGQTAAEVKLALLGKTADLWSFVYLTGTKPGIWKFRIETMEGKVLAERSLVTY